MLPLWTSKGHRTQASTRTRADLNELQADRIKAWLTQDGKIANMRERLASVSEFMKYLSQPIARRANIEDDCKGKFWESRFKCQRLLDEAAVLSAMVYVDLNPVRAAMAQDLEDSDYTQPALLAPLLLRTPIFAPWRDVLPFVGST